MSGPEVVVGLVANARSGHDIRRLVARASVFPNTEKVAMIGRALSALAAVGVDRVVSMGDQGGVAAGVLQAVERHRADRDLPWPTVEVLDLPLTGTAEDSVSATRALVGLGARALIVLGGDGTARAVASAAGAVPIATLSTGTNNAFAELGEATVVGLAAGLVATGRIGVADVCRRNKVLIVEQGDRREVALVDVAVTASPTLGARAVWEADLLRGLCLTFAEPSAIGLASIGGLVRAVGRDEPIGLRLTLDHASPRQVLAPIAPGLVVPIGIAEIDELPPAVPHRVPADGGVIAIDGEREIELHTTEATITLDLDGPWSIDVTRALELAAARGLLEADLPMR